MVNAKELKKVIIKILKKQSKKFDNDSFWPTDEYSLLEYHKNAFKRKKEGYRFFTEPQLCRYINKGFNLKDVLLCLFYEQLDEDFNNIDECVWPCDEYNVLESYTNKYEILRDFFNLNSNEQDQIMNEIFYS